MSINGEKIDQCEDCIYKTDDGPGCEIASLAYFVMDQDGRCKARSIQLTMDNIARMALSDTDRIIYKHKI